MTHPADLTVTVNLSDYAENTLTPALSRQGRGGGTSHDCY